MLQLRSSTIRVPHSICQSINRTANRSIKLASNQSTNQSINQSSQANDSQGNESTNQLINQSINRYITPLWLSSNTRFGIDAYFKRPESLYQSINHQYLSFFLYQSINQSDLPLNHMFIYYMLRSFGAVGRVYIGVEGINAQLIAPVIIMQSINQSIKMMLYSNQPIDQHQSIDDRLEWVLMDQLIDGSDRNKLFPDLRVKIKKKLVNDGLDESINQPINQLINQSTSQSTNHSLDLTDFGHLIEPKDWHERVAKFESQSINQSDNQSTNHSINQSVNDPILIDCRNFYEFEVGRFTGAQPLDIDSYKQTFDELDRMLADQSTNQTINQSNSQSDNQSNSQPINQSINQREILMYCTGGIRCIKVGSYLKRKGFQNVSSLKGGINAYLQYINRSPNQSNSQSNNQSTNQPINQSDSQSTNQSIKSRFIGKNFTFDNRIRLSTKQSTNQSINQSLSMTDDAVSHSINQSVNQSVNRSIRVTDDVLSHCYQCGQPEDAHSNCRQCKALFIQCKTCAINQSKCCSNECLTEYQSSVNQSINQPMESSTNQSINQSSGRRILRSPFNRSTSQSNPNQVNQAINQSIHQRSFTSRAINQSNNQSINQSVNQTVKHHATSIVPVSDLETYCVSQSTDVPSINKINKIKQSINQSANQTLVGKSHLLSDGIQSNILYMLALMTGRSINQSTSRGMRILEIGSFTGVSALALADAAADINQSINQSANQSIDPGFLITCESDPSLASITRSNLSTHRFNQSIFVVNCKGDRLIHDILSGNQLIDLSTIQEMINRINSQSNDQSTDPEINQSINQSNNQSINQSNNQSINQSINQSASQSNSQTIDRSTSQSIKPVFDLIFIDANKSGYLNYFNRLIDCLSINGVMIFDNTLFKGDVLQSIDQSISQSTNQSVSQSVNQSINQSPRKVRLSDKIHAFNQSIKNDGRLIVTMLPVRDGLTIIQRKR